MSPLILSFEYEPDNTENIALSDGLSVNKTICNAQKLINIMVKHTYSFCYFTPKLRENFRYCHCPLDYIMLNEVWKRYKENIGTEKRKTTLKNTEFFCRAWGNEGQEGDIQPEIYEFPERYLKYQTAIREIIGEGDLYPIEFDYIVWK